MPVKDVMVFIDPSHSQFYHDELFKETSKWNRDGQFAPFIYLRKKFAEQGIATHTADYLLDHKVSGQVNIYVSFGITTNYIKLSQEKNVILQSFFIMEPPVVAPYLYGEIGNLAKSFAKVYLHNAEGVGYERYFAGQPNLRKFFWPQIEDGIIEKFWGNGSRNFLMMINSNKKPNLKANELYTERIRALVALKRLGSVDLYGHGWDVPFYKIRQTRYFPWIYWRHSKVLRSIYKGSVESKYEALSRYKFALCFENMVMPGYLTEKIFDCLFVGTIPIYLGAPDIEQYIPKSCFIDMRDFGSYGDLHAYLRRMTDEDIFSFRESAREYLSSQQYRLFTKEKFAEQFEADLLETLKQHGVLENSKIS